MMKTINAPKELITKILVPHDFSGFSDNALQYAVEIAKKLSASLHVLHVIPYASPTNPPSWIQQSLDTQLTELNARLDKICQVIKSKHHLECSYECKMGVIDNCIVEIADQIHANFIIMGTQGAGAIKEIFYGSNTKSVIQKANCQVIAVPSEVKFSGLNRITYASDFHAADIEIIKQLMPLAMAFKTMIDVVHIVDDENAMPENNIIKAMIEKLSKHIDYKNVNVIILNGSNVAEELNNYVAISKSDLLVVATKERTFLERLFDESIAKELVYHTKIPLMAFHFNLKEEPMYFF